MNWKAVVENLREQTAFYTRQANETAGKSGFHELAEQYRRNADIASILASALRSGLEEPRIDKSGEKAEVGNAH